MHQPARTLLLATILGFASLIGARAGHRPALAQGPGTPVFHPGSSNPPDLTVYQRPAIPADQEVAAGTVAVSSATPGVSAQYGSICLPLLNPQFGPAPLYIVRDTVLANTDSNLKNTEFFGDSEPSIAINPANPLEIDILAFSGGWGATQPAPAWHSTDGGCTWTKEFSLPIPPSTPGALGCPCDQTPDFERNGTLAATFLTEGPDNLYSGTTSNPTSAPPWQWQLSSGAAVRTNQAASSINNADQPWLLVNRDPTNALQDNIYVAYDDFSSANVPLRVAVSHGVNPPSFTVDNQVGQRGSACNCTNPGHRLAVDPRNGTVYSLFQQETITAGAGGSKHINFMLNRSTDGGATWTLNGNPLGIVVASADSTQPTTKFGTVNALLGGVDHAAVDPSNGDLYYVYGNRDPGTGDNRLSIARVVTSGSGTMSVASTSFVTGQVQAALPSVAVTSIGTVGVLYDTFDGIGTGGFPKFTAHFATSADHGATFTDTSLLTFLSPATDTGDPRQRVLGDYQQVKSHGVSFYGVFTGNGAALGRSTSNMDAMYFKASGPLFFLP